MKITASKYEKGSKLRQCRSCLKITQQSRYPIHYQMCSTKHLRKSSKLYFEKQKILKPCIFCLELFQQSQVEFHTNHSCPHRLVPCIDCDDVFPLSLINQHLEICRQIRQKHQQQIPAQSTGIYRWLNGLNTLGVTLYQKGIQAAQYCNKLIKQNRAPALQYFELIRTRLNDTLQDIFVSLAYQQSIQGMSRQQIRKIPFSNYKYKNNGIDQQNCAICQCQFQNQQVIKQLKCKHIYHPICIDRWLRINKTCPLCKQNQCQF